MSKKNMSEKIDNKGKRGLKSIKLKLILVIIPLVIIATFIMLSITYKRSREIIMEYADQLVQSLTISNTHEIENWSQDIISGLNQVKNTLDNIQLSDDELMEYLKTTRIRVKVTKKEFILDFQIIDSLNHQVGFQMKIM